MRNAKSPLDHEPEAVTYARQKAGLTRTAVARELGVALSLISQIESGKRNATPAMLLKLAGVFNCPVVVLERKRDIRPQPRRAGRRNPRRACRMSEQSEDLSAQNEAELADWPDPDPEQQALLRRLFDNPETSSDAA